MIATPPSPTQGKRITMMSILTGILIAYGIVAMLCTRIMYKRFHNKFITDPECRDIPWEGVAQIGFGIGAVLTALAWPFLLVTVLPQAIRETNEDIREAKARGLDSAEYLVELKEQHSEAVRLGQLTSYQRWAEENGV